MLKPAGTDLWQEFYESSPTASFFQSPGWAKIWEQYTGGKYRPCPLIAELDGGQRLLIPLTRQRIPGGLASVWHGAPAGTYGGWLNPPAGHQDTNAPGFRPDISRLMKELFNYCRTLIFRWYPLTNIPFDISIIPLNSSLHPDRTFVIDCSGGEKAINDLIYKPGSSLKRKIMKARKSGIIIRKAAGKSDWSTYHNLYIQGIRHWDAQPQHVYGKSFFDILSVHNTNCELWLAEKNDHIIAGCILLSGINHVVYWHSAFDRSFQALRPVNLLIATVIENTIKKGYRWFDFNPSMGLTGVEEFKRSFGSRPFDSPVIERKSMLYRLVLMAKKATSRQTYRKNPE